MSHALVLTDGKAGHENQSRAFARALGCEAEILAVHFRSRFAKALSYLLDRIGIRTTRLMVFSRPLFAFDESERPHVVIGTGSGTFYAAKAVARVFGARSGVVLYPRGYHISSFDCVLAPAFDRPAAAPNVIPVPANLVASDEGFYEKGVRAFREHYRKVNGVDLAPDVRTAAVIVGGPNKCSTMQTAWMKRRLDDLFAECRAAGIGRFWVTTSRRTPPAVEALIDEYDWDYRLLYSKDRFNPIPAFVSLADTLYVTAESTGMLSEACTCGHATVRALDNLNPGPHKFRRFVDALRQDGYVDGNRKVDLSEAVRRARGLLGL